MKDMSNNIVADFQWDYELWKNPLLDYFKMTLKNRGDVVKVEYLDASSTVSIQEIIAYSISK